MAHPVAKVLPLLLIEKGQPREAACDAHSDCVMGFSQSASSVSKNCGVAGAVDGGGGGLAGPINCSLMLNKLEYCSPTSNMIHGRSSSTAMHSV